MSQLIVVGELSDDCSKVTVPVILESPRRTATIRGEHHRVSSIVQNSAKQSEKFGT